MLGQLTGGVRRTGRREKDQDAMGGGEQLTWKVQGAENTGVRFALCRKGRERELSFKALEAGTLGKAVRWWHDLPH